MIRRLAALATVALLLGARPLPQDAMVPAGFRADLDSFSDAQLLRDLRDELDDILQGNDPNEDVAAGELFDEVMEAIGDVGDEGDPEESEISLADLEDELEEADTCVEDMVREIVGMPKEGCGPHAARGAEAIPSVRGPAGDEWGGSWMRPPKRLWPR